MPGARAIKRVRVRASQLPMVCPQSNGRVWMDVLLVVQEGEFSYVALSRGPFGERSTSRLAKTSSFQDKAAGRGSFTPFAVFAAEKLQSEHGD